ncbi:MAG: hypothetical protein H6739_36400 [Alphaproteobacteria bacterium]|nr:hypothetical protein [Alphaproteobacteria bacterium]
MTAPVALRPRRVAVVDIGSNSLHLQVAELRGDAAPRMLDTWRVPVRLGAYVAGRVRPEALDAAAVALRRLATRARAAGCDEVRASATASLRDATDGAQAAATLSQISGVPVRVLSGEDEARMAWLGARRRLDLGETPALVIDLGGRSTELALGEGDRVLRAASLPLGHLRCWSWMKPWDRAGLAAHARAIVGPVRPHFRAGGWRVAAGTAGTALTLMDMAARARGEATPPDRHGLTATLPELITLVDTIEATPAPQRLEMPGFDARRRDTLLPGAVVFLELLRELEVQRVTSSRGAVREGLVEAWLLEEPNGCSG